MWNAFIVTKVPFWQCVRFWVNNLTNMQSVFERDSRPHPRTGDLKFSHMLRKHQFKCNDIITIHCMLWFVELCTAG